MSAQRQNSIGLARYRRPEIRPHGGASFPRRLRGGREPAIRVWSRARARSRVPRPEGRGLHVSPVVRGLLPIRERQNRALVRARVGVGRGV